MKRRIFALVTAVCVTAVLFIHYTLNAASTTPTYLPAIYKPEPTPTPTPIPRGVNYLPNASFEGGWYHPNGIPELQIPDQWNFWYATGPTGFGDNPWDVWVRPEVRVLPSDYLPPSEHDLFIWDGDQTVKVFKGYGAISYKLSQVVTLPPGVYQLEVSVFPDLVVAYDNGQKVYASDPLTGEVMLLAGNGNTGWLLPTFGQKNTFRYTFTVSSTRQIEIGAAMRGRWAILNNGWFTDDWFLHKIQ